MPKQTVILDSSQIETYDTCPSMWEYNYHQSLDLIQDVELENNSQKAIRMGTYGHLWLDTFYKFKAIGNSLNDCVSQANTIVKQIDELDQDPNDNHEFPLTAEQRKEVYDRLQLYWMTYSRQDVMPLCKHEYDIVGFNEAGIPIDGKRKIPLVEQGFSHELLNTSEYLFVLEGRIDVIFEGAQGRFWMDHKFQLRERNLYPKSIQFKNYSMVTGLNYGIINYVRLHKQVKDGGKTLQRQAVAFNPQELRLWRQELLDIYVDVAKNIKKGAMFGFPRRRSSCPGKFGYPCQFTHICEEPRTMANVIIDQKFKKRKEWRPW